MAARKSNVVFIALAVSLGGFLFGFDASVISGVIKYIRPEFGLDDFQLGWVVSAPTFSAMFAMLVAGSLSDRIGRKPILIIVAFLYLLSAIWSAFAFGYVDLVIARMIGGLAFGAALVLAPTYISEIAAPESRGRMVSIQQLNIVLGFSAAYFCNYWLQGSLEEAAWLNEQNVWRWMFGMECLPAVLYFGALFFVPRSPRWLIAKNRTPEAKSILSRLHGASLAEEEVQAISASIEKEDRSTAAPISSLWSRRLRFVMLVALALGILQQITGINAIFFYATTIFEQSGVGTNAAFAQAVLVGIINVVFTLVAMAFIDKFGRKPLLLIGLAGIALSMAITAFGFSQASYSLTEEAIVEMQVDEQAKVRDLVGTTFDSDLEFKDALKERLGKKLYSKHEGKIMESSINMNAIIVLIGILCFVASFAVSLGPVMWVMLPELFPNWVRGLAISAIGFTNSFTSWLIQFIFPWELNTLGNTLTYLLFSVLAVLGFVIMLKYLPETKGKSLEELEQELSVEK
jgi:SP family arabinose:H+ symporter-like MFS transporter